ncbi:MAG: hypothetical protein V4604_15925 [Bacteroidota bacterium]
MGKTELRLDLHKMIDNIEDDTTLSAIYAFLSGNKELPKSDWASDLSEDAVKSILRGLQQEAEGKVTPHEQILTKHRKQFPHLNL